MERLGFLLIAALVALTLAWLAKSLVSLLSGGESDSLFSIWFDIFSKSGGRQIDYADPLPDVLTAPRFAVGDRIRVLLLPFDEEQSLSNERRELFQKCAGKVLRVEGIDGFGALELHVLDDGTQSPDRFHNVVYLDPKYAEQVPPLTEETDL